ncbi:hypothetical protein GCM10027562_13970 [Arthrobacter pigmenti]
MAARYAKRAEPVSLTAEELDLEHEKVTTDVPGIPVWAWIRFPDSAELVKGEVFSWTSRAAQVKWVDGGGRRSTWVWASAVTRRVDQMRQTALGDRTPANDNANRSSSTK